MVAPTTPPPTVFEQKMRWILQLEDERQLRGGGGDLVDAARAIQKRASAVARRSRLAASSCPRPFPALTTLLQSDADPEVRQMAAFALGLIGDAAAAPALMTALADRRSADPGTRGRSARTDRAQGRGRSRSAR